MPEWDSNFAVPLIFCWQGRDAGNQLMWSQVQVSAQHFPVLVTRDERHFRNVEPCFEQTARRLVAKIVEVKVLDLQFPADAAKCATERSAVVRKDPIASERERALFSEQRNSVIACRIEQGHSLIVP